MSELSTVGRHLHFYYGSCSVRLSLWSAPC